MCCHLCCKFGPNTTNHHKILNNPLESIQNSINWANHIISTLCGCIFVINNRIHIEINKAGDQPDLWMGSTKPILSSKNHKDKIVWGLLCGMCWILWEYPQIEIGWMNWVFIELWIDWKMAEGPIQLSTDQTLDWSDNVNGRIMINVWDGQDERPGREN